MADKKKKALSILYLSVFETFQTDFYWWYGGILKYRELVKERIFAFYLIGFCRRAHKSIYRVKEHKILSRTLLFKKKLGQRRGPYLALKRVV